MVRPYLKKRKDDQKICSREDVRCLASCKGGEVRALRINFLEEKSSNSQFPCTWVHYTVPGETQGWVWIHHHVLIEVLYFCSFGNEQTQTLASEDL
jgi:hypothetical protein